MCTERYLVHNYYGRSLLYFRMHKLIFSCVVLATQEDDYYCCMQSNKINVIAVFY